MTQPALFTVTRSADDLRSTREQSRRLAAAIRLVQVRRDQLASALSALQHLQAEIGRKSTIQGMSRHEG